MKGLPMLAARLPLNFARTSAWLAVGMLLFPPWANFARCNCSDGKADASPSQGASVRCCQTKSQPDSCCGTEQDASCPSCSGSTAACHCSPGCNCRCSRSDDPQPRESPRPVSSNLSEQIAWGLSVPVATAGCVPLGAYSHACPSQFQRLIPASALQRCIALSRFTC